ncbi:MAG: hypothetical protein KAR33_09375 [Candidatus Thorarchaeota archaeon]|nr:hypothetical protein [Candidatus Thorarchaeota archaeon]
MAVDLLTLIVSSVMLVLSLIAISTSYRLLKEIGTKFFQYAFVFFLFLCLWSTTFIVPSLLNEQVFYDIVLFWQYLFAPFGYLALAFMIAAMESVKGGKRTILNNIGFLFVGGLIAGIFSPVTYQLTWTPTGWVNDFSVLFEIGRVVLFILVVYSTLPLIFRMFKRLRISMRRDYYTRILFWIVVVFLPFLLVIQPFRNIAPGIMQPLFHPSLILSMVTLFLLMLVILFIRHPTILFVGTHEIEEIYVIQRDSGLPLYNFSFIPENGGTGSEILSAFFTGIRHYVKHSLGSGEIERILVGDLELIIQEGIFTYGILIAKKSSDLVKNLLRVTIEEFEKKYGFEFEDHVEPQKYLGFDEFIARYFEFAMIMKEL